MQDDMTKGGNIMAVTQSPVIDELIEMRGLRFHYRDWRSRRMGAPTLVLLHGFTGHARSWDSSSAPAESEPLLIKCELTAYQPDASSGNNGTTGITLKVTFIDMKNGHVRGEFDDAQNVQGGGLQSDRDILLGFAKGAGIQIDSRIKG